MDPGARLRRDVAWNLVPVALLGAVGLGLNFVIAVWWGAAALGVFNLVTIAYFVAATVGACGLQYSVLRAVAEAPDDRPRVAAIVIGALVPNVVIAAATTGAFVLVRGAVAALHDSSAVAEGMLWAAPGLFCFAINKVLFSVVNGLRRMRAYAVYTSLRYLCIAASLLIAHAVDLAAAHLSVIWTITEGTVLLVLSGELLASVTVARARGWRSWIGRHLDFGLRGVTATLAYEVNSKLDVWMLGAFGTAKELVGIYSLAAALNEGAHQVAVVVATNLNPVMARDLAADRTSEVEALARRTRRWFVPALAGAAAIGAAVFPVLIPPVVGDPTFVAGAWPFAVLMAGLALASPYLPFNQILLMAARPGWHALLVVLVLAANFAGDLALIPRLGLLGAAVANAAAIVVSAALVRVFARARVGVRI
jgi:O-antigen/teichoic acid export membrane protein